MKVEHMPSPEIPQDGSQSHGSPCDCPNCGSNFLHTVQSKGSREDTWLTDEIAGVELKCGECAWGALVLMDSTTLQLLEDELDLAERAIEALAGKFHLKGVSPEDIS